MVVHLSKDEARRIAVHAQLLDQPRPAGVVEVVDRLTMLQIARSAGPLRGRTALLSPFDRLVHDRVRAEQLFGFEYVLEMYKPREQRRWGYFALPVLYGDRLVGKLDATVDRKAGVLAANALHEDVPFTGDMTEAVRAEAEDLATWLGVEVVSASV